MEHGTLLDYYRSVRDGEDIRTTIYGKVIDVIGEVVVTSERQTDEEPQGERNERPRKDFPVTLELNQQTRFIVTERFSSPNQDPIEAKLIVL